MAFAWALVALALVVSVVASAMAPVFGRDGAPVEADTMFGVEPPAGRLTVRA